MKLFLGNKLLNYKKENFIIFAIFCSLMTFANIQSDIRGSIGLVLVFILTILISNKFKSLSLILLVSLLIRLITIILGNNFIELPDSWGDTNAFEKKAWEMSQGGFFEVFNQFPKDSSSYYLSWILAFCYSLTGRSMILAQSISLLFGMASVFIGIIITNKIWNKKTAMKVGWILAFYPSLVLYSCIFLRESLLFGFFYYSQFMGL